MACVTPPLGCLKGLLNTLCSKSYTRPPCPYHEMALGSSDRNPGVILDSIPLLSPPHTATQQVPIHSVSKMPLESIHASPSPLPPPRSKPTSSLLGCWDSLHSVSLEIHSHSIQSALKIRTSHPGWPVKMPPVPPIPVCAWLCYLCQQEVNLTFHPFSPDLL